MQMDYSLLLDIVLLLGIVIQFMDVPHLIRKYRKDAKGDIDRSFNIFLNVIMALLVWLKLGSFVMTTK